RLSNEDSHSDQAAVGSCPSERRHRMATDHRRRRCERACLLEGLADLHSRPVVPWPGSPVVSRRRPERCFASLGPSETSILAQPRTGKISALDSAVTAFRKNAGKPSVRARIRGNGATYHVTPAVTMQAMVHSNPRKTTPLAAGPMSWVARHPKLAIH